MNSPDNCFDETPATELVVAHGHGAPGDVSERGAWPRVAELAHTPQSFFKRLPANGSTTFGEAGVIRSNCEPRAIRF